MLHGFHFDGVIVSGHRKYNVLFVGVMISEGPTKGSTRGTTGEPTYIYIYIYMYIYISSLANSHSTKLVISGSVRAGGEPAARRITMCVLIIF